MALISRTLFLVVLMLAPGFGIDALAVPCLSAAPQCAEFGVIRGGPQRLQVYRTVPLGILDEAIAQVLVIIQGAERSAETSFRIAAAATGVAWSPR
jgi:hypothetical protein